MICKKYRYLEKVLSAIHFKDTDMISFNRGNFEDIFDCSDLVDGWDYNYGASKLVLIPENLPFVIKIPFRSNVGYYSDNIWIDGEEFEEAQYPIDGTVGWDYCRTETEYFKLAEKAGVSFFFAKTTYIGTYCDYPIYIQEKCKCECDINSSHDKETRTSSRAKANKLGLWVSYLDDDFLVDLFNFYTIDEITKLSNFLEKYAIDDLSDTNVGYDYAGWPILIDYSGYNE